MVSIQIGRGHRGITDNGRERFEFRGLKPGPVRLGVGFAAIQYTLAAILLNGQDITGQTIELHPGDKLTDARIPITDDPSVNVRLDDSARIQF